MSDIRSVIVIYNPNSTGSSRDDALAFCKAVREHGLSARAVPTQRAGHARTLARQFAERDTHTMIVSASGDGGYNEVINGVLGSKHPTAVVGVLPSGNANDHYHSIHHGDPVKRIVRNRVDLIDVLYFDDGKRQRYAHSYIGLGMTPQIGKELTEQRPSRFGEIGLVIQHLFKLRPVKIRLDGKTHRYDHLLFINTGRMSKYLKVAGDGTIDDGKFEIIGTKAGSLRDLLVHLFRAASRGARPKKRTNSVTFTVLRASSIQLDGEVMPIKRGDHITVSCKKQLLRTIA